MKLTSLLIAAAGAFLALSPMAPAKAACQCACVNGQMRPICASAMDMPPICPLSICPLVPPSIRPIQTPTLPPLGTTNCELAQIMGADDEYEWDMLCN